MVGFAAASRVIKYVCPSGRVAPHAFQEQESLSAKDASSRNKSRNSGSDMVFAAWRKCCALPAESGGKDAVEAPLAGVSEMTLTRTESALTPRVRKTDSTLDAAVRARVAQAALGASRMARLPRWPAKRKCSFKGGGIASRKRRSSSSSARARALSANTGAHCANGRGPEALSSGSME